MQLETVNDYWIVREAKSATEQRSGSIIVPIEPSYKKGVVVSDPTDSYRGRSVVYRGSIHNVDGLDVLDSKHILGMEVA